MRSGSSAVALALVLACGCSDGGYDVLVRFDPPGLGASAERIEVGLVPSCDGQELGAAPGATEIAVIERMGEPEPLGEFTPGAFGLYARALGGDCGVVAAGCEGVVLEAGGSGQLVVVLTALTRPGCDPGSSCVAGRCMAGDAQVPDGGMDATMPPRDGGPDAAETIDGGRDAAPDTDAAADGGTDAGTDAGPADAGFDGGTDAGPCATDGAACPGGICRGGACCTGCWDGTACRAGGAVMACGVDGMMCASCNDGNPCTDDFCTLSGCVSTPNDARSCAGGTCHGGACCTGCWDGSTCRAGTSASFCGAAGGACSACTCPTNACSAGTCAPADTAAAIGPGHFHSCVVGASGRLYCWGENEIGQLGIGTVGVGTEELSPVRVGTASDWTGVSGGEDFTCGLRGPGALWCWGDNQHGVLMQGDFIDRQLPTRVGVANDWTRVVAGEDHACMSNMPAELWCGGENVYGQIGVGDDTDRTMATGLMGTWAAFGLGYHHTCAIRPTGTLWCWGRNEDGQLGLGDTVDRNSPVQVGTGTDWASVTGGENVTCALTSAGALWCWGLNDDGQLALGMVDVVPHPTPARVGTATWVAIDAGEDHVCGIQTGGSLWCWGENTWGQVGNGSSGSDVTTPTRVGSASDWVAVALGEDHTCGVRAGGSLWCWGANDLGQLGLGSRTLTTLPSRVCFPP